MTRLRLDILFRRLHAPAPGARPLATIDDIGARRERRERLRGERGALSVSVSARQALFSESF
jgi:hypothetical protein